MFCTKCGKEINEDSRFCRYCGAETEKQKAVKRKTGKIAAIVIAAVVLLSAAGLYFFALKEDPAEKASVPEKAFEKREEVPDSKEAFEEEKEENDENETYGYAPGDETEAADEEAVTEEKDEGMSGHTEEKLTADTSTLHANLWNWGYGCEIGEDTYISSGKALIRVTKDENGFSEETVYEWKDKNIMACLDLVADGNTIYYGAEDNTDTIYHFNAFDVSENRLYPLLSYKYSKTCYVLNKIGNRIYYYIDGSLAYIDTNDDFRTGEISLHATSISTGQDGEICVTDSGVFCSEFGNKGLKLLSYDGELKWVYEKLNGKSFYMMSERNGKLFFRFTEGDQALYVLDVKTGEYSKFTEEDIFAGMDNTRINFYGDSVFVGTGKWGTEDSENDYSVHVFSETGEARGELELSSQGSGASGGPCLLVLNDVLYTFEPLSEREYPFLGIYSLPGLERLD